MNHSNPNDRPAPREFRSRSGSDRVAALLATMIGDYYIEAARWPRTRSESIRLTADVLWDIRDQLITDQISVHNAEIWLEQGFAYLDGLMRERSRRHHPAGRNHGG